MLVLSGSPAVRSSQEEAAFPCVSQIGSFASRPSCPGRGCPGPPSIARSPVARSHLRSGSAFMAPAGANPTSTAGSTIQSDGVRNANSMKSGEVGGCPPCKAHGGMSLLLLIAVNRAGLRPQRLALTRPPVRGFRLDGPDVAPVWALQADKGGTASQPGPLCLHRPYAWQR